MRVEEHAAPRLERAGGGDDSDAVCVPPTPAALAPALAPAAAAATAALGIGTNASAITISAASRDADEWQLVSRGGARAKKKKHAAKKNMQPQHVRDHVAVRSRDSEHNSDSGERYRDTALTRALTSAAARADTATASGYKYRERTSSSNSRGRRRHDGTADALDRDGRISSSRQAGIERRVAQITLMLRENPLVLDAVRAIDAHWQLQARELPDNSATHVQDGSSLSSLSTMSVPSSPRAPEPAPAPARTALHLVSYGLGSFCASTNAVYQLAYARALLEALQQRVADGESSVVAEIFDPVMNKSDEEIAARFGLAMIATNECGRRVAVDRTVFFMPHCGKTLYENVLASNWSVAALTGIVIIGNSFEAYGDRLLSASERRASAIVRVLPYLSETPLRSGFARSHDEFVQYEAAFNDLSVLTFPAVQAREALQDAALALRMAAIARVEHSTEFDDGELIHTQEQQ